MHFEQVTGPSTFHVLTHFYPDNSPMKLVLLNIIILILYIRELR